MRKRRSQNTQPRGDVIPMFLSAVASLPVMVGIVDGVTYARGHDWLADIPQWANPFEHLNNVATQVLPQAVTIAAMIVVADKYRAAAPTLTKISGAGLLASVAYQGVGELPQTQKLVMETGLFPSSSPGAVDFGYGALAAVACYGVNRKTIAHYESTRSEALRKDMLYGPAALQLITQPGQFTSITVPSSNTVY